MEENNPDKYFQEKLAAHSETPPPAVWEGIASELPKGGFFRSKRLLLILLLLLSAGSAGYLGYRLYQVDSRVAELENQIQNQKSNSTAESQSVSGNPTEQADEQLTAKSNGNSSNASEKNTSGATREKNATTQVTRPQKADHSDSQSSREAVTGTIASVASEDKAVSTGIFSATTKVELNSKSEKFSQNPNIDSGANQTEQLNTQAQRMSSEKSKLQPNTGSLGFSPIALQSIQPITRINPEFSITKREADYYSEPGRDWFLFVYGMASYTHRRVVATSEGSEGLPSQLDKVENGLITPGAGLQLSRELGKSLRLSLGVEYNQWIQEGTYLASVSVNQVELINNPTTQSQEYNFDGQLFGSLGTNAFSSSSTENPFNTGFETLSPTDQVAFRIDSRRQINYLSIPLTLEYIYKAYPFTFTAGAGISLNPVIGSSTEYSMPDSLPDFNFSEEDNFSGTYLSFQAGLAVEYGISERMSIRLNPVYRGWMTPIFENEAIRTLPFGVALRAGVVYQFGKK